MYGDEMTNEELIKKLKEFPLDAIVTVVAYSREGDNYRTISKEASFELIKRSGGFGEKWGEKYVDEIEIT